MNIQKISGVQNYNAQISYANNKITIPQTKYGIELKQPINADEISFNGKTTTVISKEVKAALARKEARKLRDLRLIAEAKILPEKTKQTKKSLEGEERKEGISISNAKQVREMILKPQKQIHNFMGRIFGDLKVSLLSPKNLLLDFSDRAKSVLSIMEKSSTREWNSIKEVLGNMTDLNGAKIVMNYKTGKPEAEAVIDRLIPLIKTKQIRLQEIELQRPEAIELKSEAEQERFDYVSKLFLDKLEDAQEEVINGLETNIDKIVLIDRPLPKYTKGNYCALHLLLQLNEKGSRPFELQVMGPRMAKGKPLDDKRFKHFEGKEIGKNYAKLTELWEPLRAKENKAAKEEFLRYCKDANLQLREDELREYETQRHINRPTGLFKSVREYNLTPEYDLNRLYSIMLACEKSNTAEKTKEKLEKTLDEQKITPVQFTKDTLHKLFEKFGSKHAKDSHNQKLK